MAGVELAACAFLMGTDTTGLKLLVAFDDLNAAKSPGSLGFFSLTSWKRLRVSTLAFLPEWKLLTAGTKNMCCGVSMVGEFERGKRRRMGRKWKSRRKS